MSYTSACNPCQPTTTSTYRFYPATAAKAAVTLAKFSPYNERTRAGVLDDFGDYGTYSAMFMSLCYYAGGIPMVLNRALDLASLGGGNDGWYAFLAAAGINGNGTWNAHSSDHVLYRDPANLTASGSYDPYQYDHVDNRPEDNDTTKIKHNAGCFWTNADPYLETGTGCFQDIPLSKIRGNGLLQFLWGTIGQIRSNVWAPTASSRTALFVPVRKFFNWVQGQNGGALNFSSYQFKSGVADFTKNVENLQKVRFFQTGDYVYYATTNRAAHGLFIAGQGPLIDWNDYLRLLDRVPDLELDSTYSDIEGYRFSIPIAYRSAQNDPGQAEPGKIRDYTGRFETNSGLLSLTVPYVVDWWNPNPKLQGPRPFYATRINQSTHSYWLFVPAPTSADVLCEYAYERNCPDAWLHIDPDDPNAATNLSSLIKIDPPSP